MLLPLAYWIGRTHEELKQRARVRAMWIELEAREQTSQLTNTDVASVIEHWVGKGI